MSVMHFNLVELAKIGKAASVHYDPSSRVMVAKMLEEISHANTQAFNASYKGRDSAEASPYSEILGRMMVGSLSVDDLESAATSAALLFYNCISQNGTDFATPSAKQAIITILCGVCRRQRDMIQTMRGQRV